MADLTSITADDFAPLVGEAFLISHDDGDVEVELSEVQELGSESANTAQGFSLLFEGRGTPLIQATYPVAHPDLGELLLFLVPVGEHEGVRQYEAIFTRL